MVEDVDSAFNDDYLFVTFSFFKLDCYVIIEAIMEFIMNTSYFKIQHGSSKYVLYWRDAPDGLAKFLKRIEIVFTRIKVGV